MLLIVDIMEVAGEPVEMLIFTKHYGVRGGCCTDHSGVEAEVWVGSMTMKDFNCFVTGREHVDHWCSIPSNVKFVFRDLNTGIVLGCVDSQKKSNFKGYNTQ